MLGLDDPIVELSSGGGLAVAAVVALLLGLRHATDPDHITAVTTLVAGEERGARRAAGLGLAWGLGHAFTLFALGLPVVLFGEVIPEAVHTAAEAGIGAVIVALAARLLVRWRRGYFHAHPHSHGDLRHSHPHAHEHEHHHRCAHEHPHEESLGRTPVAAFGIGLVHGVGGSVGVGILLVGAISGGPAAVAALGLFAAGTAISMAAVSGAFGAALASYPVARRMEALAPVLGAVGLLFGSWYSLGALGSVPHAL